MKTKLKEDMRILRYHYHMTIYDMATQLGVPSNQVSLYESAQAYIDQKYQKKLLSFLSYLDVPEKERLKIKKDMFKVNEAINRFTFRLHQLAKTNNWEIIDLPYAFSFVINKTIAVYYDDEKRAFVCNSVFPQYDTLTSSQLQLLNDKLLPLLSI